MMQAEQFLTKTLKKHPYGEKVTQILAAAINAVEPGSAIRRFVQMDGEILTVDGREYDLSGVRHIHVAAIGKASILMSSAVADLLGDKFHRGLVVCKHFPEKPDARFETLQGGHPVPNEKSHIAGRRLLEFVKALGKDDLLICLISGGGSALVTAPVECVSLEDMQMMTQTLLDCGARIDEINTLRRHLDLVKGGGLVKAAMPARVISLILSDVVNSPLEAIASGPTAPDPSTLEDVLRILRHYEIEYKVPLSILKVFSKYPETLKPGHRNLKKVQNVLVASNELASEAALACAEDLGFEGLALGNDWQGEAQLTAGKLLQKLPKCKAAEKPICAVAGGETTVTIQGSGKGGRNQELALAAVDLLDCVENKMLVTLATDGEDGPTDAAGAVVTCDTKKEANSLGMNPSVYLKNNDAFHFFDKLDDLLKPGPSGTNVNDLTFLFVFPD